MRSITMVLVMFCVGCGGSKSPIQPTPPVQFSLSGLVEDTAFRPLPAARVEIMQGAQAGAFAITDDRGQFKMSGPFTGTLTVLASKEGYQAATQDTQGIPVGPEGKSLGFRLQPTGPSVDITGEYTLTLIADSTCTALPDVARSRTYKLAISPTTQSPLPLFYKGLLSGATFYRNYQLDIGVSGSNATLVIGDYGDGLIEELGSAYVEIWGNAYASVNGSISFGSFSGAFTYCDSPAPSCPVPAAYCESPNHRFTLTGPTSTPSSRRR